MDNMLNFLGFCLICTVLRFFLKRMFDSLPVNIPRNLHSAWTPPKFVSSLSRTLRLAVAPIPVYTNTDGGFSFVGEPNRFAQDLVRYIDGERGTSMPNAPYPLGKYWWHIEETSISDSTAVLIIEYVEDLVRTGLSQSVNFQRFNMRLQLSWIPRLSDLFGNAVGGLNSRGELPYGLIDLNYRWTVENADRYRSGSASLIVEYTLEQIRKRITHQLSEQNSGPPNSSSSANAQTSKFAGSRNGTSTMSPQGSLLGALLNGGRNRRASSELEHRFTHVPEHMAGVRSTNSWPTPQDFNEAVQLPASAFSDSELRAAAPLLSPLGLPKAVTGAFASVYQMHSTAGTWAVKCFLREVHDQAERYEQITDALQQSQLSYAIGFEYIPNGIRTNQRWYPILKMDWLEGATMQEYIDHYRNDLASMNWLCGEFANMIQAVQAHGIAHGDLQHGNIVITEHGLRLIDYDGMFVPSMMGFRSNELGHRNYQHPQRNEMHFGPYTDNFSAWVIYLTLQFIAMDPTLWEREWSGDECLLLRQSDYAAPLQSPLLLELGEHSNPQIREYANLLTNLCLSNVERIPPLNQVVVLGGSR